MIKEFAIAAHKNKLISDSSNSNLLTVETKEKLEFSIETCLNKYDELDTIFTQLSSILNHGDFLSGHFFSNGFYKQNIKERNTYLLFNLKYAGSVIYHRVLPKLIPFVRSAYIRISKNNEKFLSKPEVLGRLYKYGFKIIDFSEVDKVCYFKVQKINEPDYSKANLWPICKLRRIGKNGKLKTFYKFRTMHPYSEYMQEFIYLNYGLEGGDKFCNDFRIPRWGKILRKYWLDELPMIINLIKGDLKLVGPRPLTVHKYGLYSKELQQLRTKFKPGLLPPYYADLPNSLEGVMESEKRYILAFEKDGWKTDVKYFFRIIKNIIIKKARSK